MLFKKHYPELDFLRVVAITMVMAMHFAERLFALPKEHFFTTVMLWGWNGVTLFFVLSGFLIGGQIIEENRAGTFSIRRFYLKRFWRIFPPYYVAILLAALSFSVGSETMVSMLHPPTVEFPSLIKTVLVYAFYLQNYVFPEYLFQNNIYWSLAVEEQFYLLAPVVLLVLARLGNRKLFTGLALLISTGIALRFILYSAAGDFLLDFEWPFHTRFDTLLFGVLAAYLFLTYNERLMALPRALKATLGLAGFLCLAVSLKFGTHGLGYFNVTWQYTLTGLGFALVILCMVIASSSRYIYPKRVFAYIAKLSYEMYLYHLILMWIARRVIHDYIDFRVESFFHFAVLFAAYYIFVVLSTSVIYWLVDRPSMNYRKKILSH